MVAVVEESPQETDQPEPEPVVSVTQRSPRSRPSPAPSPAPKSQPRRKRRAKKKPRRPSSTADSASSGVSDEAQEQERAWQQLEKERVVHGQVVAEAHRCVCLAIHKSSASMRVGQADHGVVGRGLKSARQALERNQTATMRRGAWMGRAFWAWYPHCPLCKRRAKHSSVEC